MGSLVFGAALIGLWATFSWLPFWIQNLVSGTCGQKERGLAMMTMGGGGLFGGFISGWVVHALGLKRTLLICFGASFILAFILFKLTTTLIAGYLFSDCIHYDFFWHEPGSTVHVYSGTIPCFAERYSYRRLF